MDIEVLRSLGITDAEITTYLTLLKKGDLLASQVSELTKIHRTNVYDILEKLIQKGLVGFQIIEKKKYFRAADPKHITVYFEEQLFNLKNRRSDVDGLIKDLQEIQETPKKMQDVEVFTGKNGLKVFLEEFAKDASFHDAFSFVSSSGKVFETLEFYFPHYIRRVMKLRLKGRILAQRSIVKHKLFFRPLGLRMRWLPETYEPSSTFVVMNDKLGIYNILEGEDPFIIMIRSESIAQAYKDQFDLMWKSASKK